MIHSHWIEKEEDGPRARYLIERAFRSARSSGPRLGRADPSLGWGDDAMQCNAMKWDEMSWVQATQLIALESRTGRADDVDWSLWVGSNKKDRERESEPNETTTTTTSVGHRRTPKWMGQIVQIRPIDKVSQSISESGMKSSELKWSKVNGRSGESLPVPCSERGKLELELEI